MKFEIFDLPGLSFIFILTSSCLSSDSRGGGVGVGLFLLVGIFGSSRCLRAFCVHFRVDGIIAAGFSIASGLKGLFSVIGREISIRGFGGDFGETSNFCGIWDFWGTSGFGISGWETERAISAISGSVWSDIEVRESSLITGLEFRFR